MLPSILEKVSIHPQSCVAQRLNGDSGAETPPGEESHLTRAMKAYYLEKARDPSDLPNWLFDKRELRAVASRPEVIHRHNEERSPHRDDRPPLRQNRGLRAINFAATEASTERPVSDRPRVQAGDVQDDGVARSSRANDRLKAIRDAKRHAAQRNITPDAYDGHGQSRERWNISFEHDRRPDTVHASRLSPRKGLPTRPGHPTI
jgi:hypothetical protein